MSVLIKDMEMPESCMWRDGKCPLLGDDDDCKLQNCQEEWTWQDQYKGCPLSEAPEPCEDVVSRQAVYTVIEEVLYETTKGADNWYGLLNDGVRTLPSVTPKPQWIPCSERLPEKNGRYIVTRGLKACNSIWNRVYIVNYSDLMGLKAEKIWWDGNVGKSDFQRVDDVLAWMPLPSPYHAERREDG